MSNAASPTIGEVDSRVRAAWQSQVAVAKQTSGLLPLLTRQRHELLPRFAAFYHQLRRLPRRLRRHWQRRGRQALAGVALLLTLGQGLALADKIQVDGITCTLINAIVTANSDVNTGGCVQLPSATAGADRIVLQHRSVHTLTEVNNVTYEATGLPVVTSEITIKGSGSTIKRSSEAPDFRILAVSNLGKLTLKHTTISGGVASGPSGGGGIFNLGTLALEKSTVSGNSASAAGGGVLNRVTGPVAQPSKVRLSHSTVSGNTADGSGGGVANYTFLGGHLEVRLVSSTVSGNTAGGSGGGVANVGARVGFSTLRLTDSTISSNSAGADGGGVLNFGHEGGGSVTLTNSTVSGNAAGGSGGGVANQSAFSGGGGATLIHSTVSGNAAGGSGGGVANQVSDVSVSSTTLIHTLLSGNTAPTGAEVSRVSKVNSTITANNSNLFGHNALTNAQAFASFTPGAADLTATSDSILPTALSAILDTTLADNGGRTNTHNLVPESPAIDAVPLFDCPPPTTDQRGFGRPVDGDGDTVATCDIGAVEFGAAP